ncbi:MAG: hypothetical protein N2511_02530 [Thermodesulfovibrionales bacterium]|nr:hypothetical protein [Thermodesulfovibrionales bacterium]
MKLKRGCGRVCKNISFSPDGKYIVFQALTDSKNYENREIFVSKPDGSDMRNLTHNPSAVMLPYGLPMVNRYSLSLKEMAKVNYIRYNPMEQV